ncbi:MAG TPA: KamA family radical SAM protein [Rectinemataceae bacterium]
MADRLKHASALEEGNQGPPFAVPGYWLALAGEDWASCSRDERGMPLDPILAQALPSPLEAITAPGELIDPLGESEHSPVPRVVHQYPSRVLVRASGECALYCRYCFRRNLLPRERGFIDAEAMGKLTRYLESHLEVREVLVSGGDPLAASNELVTRLLDSISAARSATRSISIRICTRMPVALPERMNPELLGILEERRPIRMAIQVNHPAELSADFGRVCERILKGGIPLLSQTVLLRGINDSADILEELFSGLAHLGVHPYYLFQGDLAAGTSHFRVPLSRGLSIYAELRTRMSGAELPRYAVDAPGGGGKLYLPEDIAGQDDGDWVLKSPGGQLYRYPEES